MIVGLALAISSTCGVDSVVGVGGEEREEQSGVNIRSTDVGGGSDSGQSELVKQQTPKKRLLTRYMQPPLAGASHPQPPLTNSQDRLVSDGLLQRHHCPFRSDVPNGSGDPCVQDRQKGVPCTTSTPTSEADEGSPPASPASTLYGVSPPHSLPPLSPSPSSFDGYSSSSDVDWDSPPPSPSSSGYDASSDTDSVSSATDVPSAEGMELQPTPQSTAFSSRVKGRLCPAGGIESLVSNALPTDRRLPSLPHQRGQPMSVFVMVRLNDGQHCAVLCVAQRTTVVSFSFLCLSLQLKCVL